MTVIAVDRCAPQGLYVAEGGQGPGLAVADPHGLVDVHDRSRALARRGLPAEIPPFRVQVLALDLWRRAHRPLALRRRANGGPLLFAGLAFLLYYGLMAVSPILNSATIAGNVLRMHNLIYVIIPVVIALAHLRAVSASSRPDGRQPDPGGHAGWRRSSGSSP